MDRVKKEEVLNRVKEKRNILHETKRRKDIWIRSHIAHVLPSKRYTKGNIQWKGRRAEDVSIYWMTLRKREGNWNPERGNNKSHFGERVLEKAMDLSYGRLRNDDCTFK